MDDIAVIFDDPSQVEQTLANMEQIASKLGLSFNAKKCGISNSSQPLKINNEEIPIVTEERAYKYLGTLSFPDMMGGIEACFAKSWQIADLIEKSKLTPMQKLHAIRTKLVPMLYHLLENSHTTQNQLNRMSRALRKMTKRLLFHPERAANAYIHLHRMYGGSGVPDLLLVKARQTIQGFIIAYNLCDDLGVHMRKYLLGSKSVIEVLAAINNRRRAGLPGITKEVANAIFRIRSNLDCEVNITLFEDRMGLNINNVPYRNPWPTLSRLMQKQSLQRLLNAPNQGRFWPTLSANPISTKSVYNFHTKLCESSIHKVRLNLVPTRASFTWKRGDSQICRRCQAQREKLSHVINTCSTRRRAVIQRHNSIRDEIIQHVNPKYRVMKEQRFGSLQADIVVQEDFHPRR